MPAEFRTHHKQRNYFLEKNEPCFLLMFAYLLNNATPLLLKFIFMSSNIGIVSWLYRRLGKTF